MAERFTSDGSDRLEDGLAELCREVAGRVTALIPRERLEGLFLGGGYGRGEGGVWKTDEGDRPYNDLEFYLFARGHPRWNERRFSSDLRVLARDLSEKAGVEVEFKISSAAVWRRSPVTMFSYDLAAGHRRVWGDESLFEGGQQHTVASAIPLFEATRLLMNRCSGLLFAWAKLQGQTFTPDDADFVGRNLAKAELGLGDALLAALGQYHWSCRQRHQRLEKLELPEDFPWFSELLERHRAGVEFKLHPKRAAARRSELCRRHSELVQAALPVWLWLESRRLQVHFDGARQYALCPIPKCPESSLIKNLLAHARIFGLRGFGSARVWRYPRERLLNVLALLLWEPAVRLEPELGRFIQEELRTSAENAADLVAAYEKLWQPLS